VNRAPATRFLNVYVKKFWVRVTHGPQSLSSRVHVHKYGVPFYDIESNPYPNASKSYTNTYQIHFRSIFAEMCRQRVVMALVHNAEKLKFGARKGKKRF
jgi:hypothetical protein